MKLKEFVVQYRSSFKNDVLRGEALKALLPILKEVEEFKNIKEINFVELPNYMGDLHGRPLTKEEEPITSSDKKIICQTEVHKLGQSTRFNDILNLYYIALSPAIYDPKDFDKLGLGVFRLPTVYDKGIFATNEIRIRWNSETLQGNTEDLSKREILNQVERLLDSGPNILGKRAIMIRCTQSNLNFVYDSDFYVESEIEVLEGPDNA